MSCYSTHSLKLQQNAKPAAASAPHDVHTSPFIPPPPTPPAPLSLIAPSIPPPPPPSSSDETLVPPIQSYVSKRAKSSAEPLPTPPDPPPMAVRTPAPLSLQQPTHQQPTHQQPASPPAAATPPPPTITLSEAMQRKREELIRRAQSLVRSFTITLDLAHGRPETLNNLHPT